MKLLLASHGLALAVLGAMRTTYDYPVTIFTPESKPDHMRTDLVNRFNQQIELELRPKLELNNLGFTKSYTNSIKSKRKAHENQSTSKFIPNTRKQH